MKLLITLVFLLSSTYSFAQFGQLEGEVREDSTKKVIPFSKIKVYKQGALIRETTSDAEGNFIVKDLSPATIDVSCEEKSYKKKILKGVIITEDHTTIVSFPLKKK